MTREEALDEIKSWAIPSRKGREVLETLIPELAESEEERIIKTLQEYVKNRNWPLNGPTQEEVLAWLKKQKINTEGDFGKGYNCGYQAGYSVAMNEMKPKVAAATLDSEKQKELPFVKDVVLGYPGLYFYDGERMHFQGSPVMEEKQKEPHYTKRNALFDKCVENCDPTIMKKVSDKVDEMLEKEQKPVKLNPLATLLSNYLKNDFEYFATKKWDEKKWNEVMNIQASELLKTAKNELEKEQKPVEYLSKRKVYDIMNKLTELSTSELIPLESEEYVKIHEITSDVCSLLDYPIEQKSVECIEHKFDNEFENQVSHLIASVLNGEYKYSVGFVKYVAQSLLGYAKNELKPVEIHIDNPNIQKTDPNVVIETRTDGTGELDGKALLYTADKSYQIGFRDGVASVNPEWSEEDEGELQNAIDALEFLGKKGVYKSESGYDAALQAASWLKSLRPSWKPSEEQMKALEDAWLGCDSKETSVVLSSLMLDLKKLM